jgi:proline iminopeptidase
MIASYGTPRDDFVEPIPEEERKDIVLAYHAQLNSVDEGVQLRAAKAWSKWECVNFSHILCLPTEVNERMATSRLFVDPKMIQKAAEDDWALAFAKIENHYFVNSGFMREGQLLEKQAIDKM